MEKIRTVIIDSGIMKSHKIFQGFSVNQEINIAENGSEIMIDYNIDDTVGHGTAVAGIFAQRCPQDEYVIVKVFQGEDLYVDTQMIVAALEYVDHNIRCDVIHMSLGCVEDAKELRSVCERLTDKGIVIVSAFDNGGSISFPAAYPNVIGVDITPYCKKFSEYVFVKNSCANILARSAPVRTAWIHYPYYLLQQGSSFTAPFITTLIMDMMRSGLKGERLMDALEKNSLKVVTKKKEDNVDKGICFAIKNAALFPYNKEMHSLVRFSHMLSFHLSMVCDLKYSRNVGRYLQEMDQYILDFLTADLTDVDTLILGHTAEMNDMLPFDIWPIIAEKCMQYGLNVYSFDNEFSKYCESKGLQICNAFPGFSSSGCLNRNFGKLYTVPVPVIGVYGTESKQGKFTLQLYLREYFSNLGYSVGQIGTEPSALLFGMDGVVPFGYHSSVSMGQRDFFASLNQLIYRCAKDRDLLFIGCQSGTVPRLYNHMNQITLEQINFIIAAMADIAVLCVNPDDDLEYIQRTVEAIHGVAQTVVICLVIFPMKYKSNWGFVSNIKEEAREEEMEAFAAKVKEKTGLNSYVLDKRNIKYIGEEIINALS